MKRSALLSAALMCLAILLNPGSPAHAQQPVWPAAKPVRIVVAFGPGSASDLFARMVSEQLQKTLNQAVVVENRPGASGQIAAELVATAPGDGYTLFLTTNTTHSANPHLFKSLRYDPIRDFTAVVRIAYFPFAVFVRGDSRLTNLRELIAQARSRPRGLTYAYTSSAGQIAAAALANSLSLEMVGVAYKAAPEAITSVISEQVDFTVLDFATTRSMLESKRLKAIAVTPSQRSALAPDLPTISEEIGLKDFGTVAWMGIFGPANLPDPVLNRLSRELIQILDTAEFRARIASMGAEPAIAGPAEFGRFVSSELAVWKRLIGLAKIQPE